jgi:ATP-binding cassette subfamily C exporter for protease/lipase
MMKPPFIQPSELSAALRALRRVFRRVLLFSVVTNLLVLAPTAYMLEVYDRVVNSRSHSTLLMLTLLVLAAYAMMEILEWVRAEMLHRASLQFDAKLNARIFSAVFHARLDGNLGSARGWNDFRTLRDFVSSPAILALLDAPISLLFLLLIFLINFWMGIAALAGAVVLAVLAFATEQKTHKPLTEANQHAAESQVYVDSSLRNAEVIEAMGMLGALSGRWTDTQGKLLVLQAEASDHAGLNAALSKFLHLTQSSLLLGMGAWLMIRGDFPSGGMMIVASVLGGRAVAPLVQLISMWKTLINARDAYARLDELLSMTPRKKPDMPLPAPTGAVAVEGVVASAPGVPFPIIRGISFAVPAGTTVAIIGPTGSGKSSLARLLVGLWPASSGKVRLDGADVHDWNKAELGPHIGYVPQDVELFDGTFAENISRFGEPDMSLVEAAAGAVGLHELIAALPQGYDAPIGDDGCFLSGGQRQRVALARAIYGAPRLIVLDEPNSSLDEAGEQALLQTLQALKAQGATTLIISHRPSILPVVDRILVMRDGTAQGYGPRDEILASLSRPAEVPAPASASATTPTPAAATP